jgi:hypothetical protein
MIAGALMSLISGFISGGCGQACVQSSKAEQIYEIAGQDLHYVAFKLGMLGQNEFLTGIENFIQAGISHLQSLQQQGDTKAADGITNLQKSMAGNVNEASKLPAAASTPLDLAQAQTVFIPAGSSGWYADAIAAGNQLALAYLQSLQSAGSSFSVSPTTGEVTVLGTSFSPIQIGLALGAVALGVYFFGGNKI